MNKRKSVVTLTVATIMIVAVLAMTFMAAGAKPATIELEGRTEFVGVFSSGFVFSPDWFNFCDATATLSQIDSKTLRLEVTECGGMRTCIWEYGINRGGVVKGGLLSCVPDFETGSLVGEVELHTGCPVTHGTFPVYHGTWDGSAFNAYSDFNGRCDGGTYWGEAWFWEAYDGIPAVPDPDGILDDGVTWDDGPAHVTFGLELTVVD